MFSFFPVYLLFVLPSLVIVYFLFHCVICSQTNNGHCLLDMNSVARNKHRCTPTKNRSLALFTLPLVSLSTPLSHMQLQQRKQTMPRTTSPPFDHLWLFRSQQLYIYSPVFILFSMYRHPFQSRIHRYPSKHRQSFFSPCPVFSHTFSSHFPAIPRQVIL